MALKKYFESTEYSSIFAFVEISNERSLRAHQKIGFEIVTKSPDDKNRLQGKQSYKIVLTRTAFDKTQKRFEGTRDADK